MSSPEMLEQVVQRMWEQPSVPTLVALAARQLATVGTPPAALQRS